MTFITELQKFRRGQVSDMSDEEETVGTLGQWLSKGTRILDINLTVQTLSKHGLKCKLNRIPRINRESWRELFLDLFGDHLAYFRLRLVSVEPIAFAFGALLPLLSHTCLHILLGGSQTLKRCHLTQQQATSIVYILWGPSFKLCFLPI